MEDNKKPVQEFFKKIINSIKNFNDNSPKFLPEKKSADALFMSGWNNTSILLTEPFNGEKNLGEIGPVKEYWLDYEILRERGWSAYLTNEVVQIIINRMAIWVIGRGLRLQADPSKIILNSEGIDIDVQLFSKIVEARFSLYKENALSSYSKMKNISLLESTAYKNAKIGGDVLVILRYQKGCVSVDLIDGCHVRSPAFGSEWWPEVLPNGNRIMNGVEMDVNGQHLAYYVWNINNTFTRIGAINPTTGLKVAYFVGGLEYRLDNARCIPILSGLLETLSKMDRYKEATIGSAEETAKVAYQIVHQAISDGSNPLQAQVMRARDVGKNDGTIPIDIQNKKIADKVAASTNKQVFNLTQGSKLEPLDKSKGEIYFKDFYAVFFDLVCAAVGIPPNVAASKYDTSFSSARAAIKDWEHTLIVERYNHSLAFNQPIYEFWLHMEILQNKIQAPGYLLADLSGNYMVLAAYRKAKWMGDNVPHIDPKKEAETERIKLGPLGANIPLTTVEQATENLNGGESQSNLEQFANELEEAKELGLDLVPIPENTGNNKKQKSDPQEKD